MTIKKNIEDFQSRLGACKLIAVSKTHPVEKIKEAYEAGQRDFGENKVQELVSKQEVLPKDIQWHLIGHLQSNKVKYIAHFITLIHSVDSLKLLQEIDKQGRKNNRVISCLLQVYIANEETKFGLSEEEVLSILNSAELAALQNVRIIGLMGMATLTENEDQIRNEFGTLRGLFQKIKTNKLPANVEMIELSIGMSSDYTVAKEMGSTMVRVGSSIFGNR